MKRSALKRALPQSQARTRQWTGGAITPRTPAAPTAQRTLAVAPLADGAKRRVVEKVPERKSQAIRDSARGEECLVRIVGVCNFNPETTVWSHAPMMAADRGIGLKSLDLAGALCCSSCHAVVDGQAPLPPNASRASVLLDWFFGHLRSLVRLRQKGLV